jgi:glucose/arabinose dehydrogenase
MQKRATQGWRYSGLALALACGISGTAMAEKILVFSETAGFRHGSIETGQARLQSIAGNNGWEIDLTEDSSNFNSANLAQYDVVVWLSTTGDVLTDTEQTAFESYIESGGGYVGIHAASDTEYDWPWYGDLVGAYFLGHPAIQDATLIVEDNTHASTDHLGATWDHNDEWYNFQSNPRTNVNVVMSLDETSYAPGDGAMGDHPISWYHSVGNGRAFYTGLGHTDAAFASTDFIQHIEGALSWAGNMTSSVPIWTGAPPLDQDFVTSVMGTSLNQPMELDISEAGELFVVGRLGQVWALENGTLIETSVIPVSDAQEGGLIGFALDPDFDNNRYAYFHYTHPTDVKIQVTRMTINADLTLNFASESVLLSYDVQMDECCHVAGSMDFDSEGNLYIATGDNTNPFASSGYTPIDEQAGRSAWDAQGSSANTNDLRGKILRITPTANGSYSIPAGNLFTADSTHRGEIYTMGHRNPFRIAIDPGNDMLFWGEVGPDAGGSNPDRGPGGYDELNKTAAAGNFGWPYFSGANEAYIDYDFATATSGSAFDPTNVVNDSPNNTGATNLPDAQPAWVTMGHRALMTAGVYRWDPEITDPNKLPSYFHGRLLYWNFNNDNMFEAAVDEETPVLRQWLDTSVMAGIIDGVISPNNGRLYMIAFGGNCCSKPTDNGLLVEVQYIGEGDTGIGAGSNSYAINGGGNSYTAEDGTVYQNDNFATVGGSSDTRSDPIADTNDDTLYQSHHFQVGGFSYNFPIENGDYNVTLKFAETYASNVGQRVFHVDAEGSRIVNSLDLIAVAGHDTAYDVTQIVTVIDGSLDLDFVPSVENPLVSAISISKAPEFREGTYITFFANTDGEYVSTTGGTLLASEEVAGDDETFLIVDAGDGNIALQHLGTGNYITVLANGQLSASATSVGVDESFILEENTDGSYSFLSVANGFYVAAESGGSAPLVADREVSGRWEAFTLAEAEVCTPSVGYAIECRPNAKAYLNMPVTAAGDLSNVPALLSATGAYSDTASMTLIDSFIPFEPIAPLWSDFAKKYRWVSVPSGKKVEWSEEKQKWGWPAGTVFLKHFELETNESDSSVIDRLETRLLVVREGGLVYGVTYKWRDDNSEADLLFTSLEEDILITSPDGDWTQTWSYPSTTDCLSCHAIEAEGVLGPSTAALNGDYTYPSGISDNQLKTLNHIGLFSVVLNESDIPTYPAHAHIADETKTLEHRVKSYWDSNCSSCHGRQGMASIWDARFETPLEDQGIVSGELAHERDYFAEYGLANALVVDPGNINNSVLYIRDLSVNPLDRMPPLAKGIADDVYMEVLERWINSLAPNSGTSGLIGDYYNNLDFTAHALTRTDANIDFSWGTGSPDPLIDADTFSVRWTGLVTPDYSETYTFYTNSDDGIRVWVNGTQLIDNWTNHGPTINSGSISLTAGTAADIVVEYYENGIGAVIELEWESSTQAREIVPTSALSTTSVSDSNVALTGTASQSDTAHGGAASRAIDGNTSGVWSDGSITHTSGAVGDLWQVELDADYDVSSLNIYNRTNCCSARLSDYTVTVLDVNENILWTSTQTSQAGSPTTLAVSGASNARIVRITQNLDEPLSLAEVEVMGH